MTTETQVTKLSMTELTALVLELQARIVVLETPKPATNASQREMTDDDARRILNGDLKDTKHKDAGEKLNLSYGQIYSCRLGYTFKAIHKELSQVQGYKNSWIK
jgi:hypothetical protein